MNYSEFLAATLTSIELAKEEKLYSAFRYFDTHETGFITFESVLEALNKSNVLVDVEGLRQVFNQFEAKKKGIDFEKFKAIVFPQLKIAPRKRSNA